PPGKTRKSFAISRASLFNKLPRQMGRGRRFVPVQCLQIIAHKLFVETGRAAADVIFVGRPETGGIGSQTFADQQQLVAYSPEFDFGVVDNVYADRGIVASFLVPFEPESARQLALPRSGH